MRHLFPTCLFAAAGAATAATAQPDMLVFDSDRLNGGGDAIANYELHTMTLDGSAGVQLTNNNTYDSWWPRPSPDGSRIIFCRTPAGVHDSNNAYAQVSLWRINSDGTGLIQLRAVGADGWTIQGHQEWSPDGTKLCTIGTASGVLQIFTMNTDGGSPVQVTTDSVNKIDCSWSRDGSKLLVVSKPSAAGASSTQEVYTVPVGGSSLTRLTTDTLEDYDPYYSPDGTHIAWLTLTNPDYYGVGLGVWNIRVMKANGQNVGYITNDLNINSKPEWSRDGSTIYFHRLVYAPGAKFDVYSTPASGGGAITAVSPGAPGNNEYPAHLHHAPVVSITAPVAGAVTGTISITADAVSSVAITKVRFQVDGVTIATDSSAPYAYSWKSGSVSSGNHTIRAIATDIYASSTTSSGVTVSTISSGGGGGGGGSGGGGGGCGLGGGVSALLLLVLSALGLRRSKHL